MSSVPDEDPAYLDSSYLNKPIPKNLIDEYDFTDDYKSIEAELRVKYTKEYTDRYRLVAEGNIAKKVAKKVAKELQEIKDSINLFSSRYGLSYTNKYENGHYYGTYHEKAIQLLEKIYDVAYITVTIEPGNRYITFGPKLDDEIENVKNKLKNLETRKRVRDADRLRKASKEVKRKHIRRCIE